MTIRMALIALLVLLHVLSQSAYGEIYRWTNVDGSIGITDDANKIPPQYREQVLKTSKSNSDSGDGSINYSKPVDRSGPAAIGEVRDEPEPKPRKEMTEEERKKADAEIRGVWDNMKKALRGY